MGQRLLAASPPCHDAKSSQHNNEAPAIVHRVAVLLHHSATESHKTSKSSGRKVSSVQLNSRYGVTGTREQDAYGGNNQGRRAMLSILSWVVVLGRASFLQACATRFN